jgi:hypothetical protein
MVTPVNSDQVIRASADKPAPAKQRAQTNPEASRQPATTGSNVTRQEPAPDVENARQLYQLATDQSEMSGQLIETSDQARNLVERILQQIASAPADVLKIQSPESNTPLGNLLASAPN